MILSSIECVDKKSRNPQVRLSQCLNAFGKPVLARIVSLSPCPLHPAASFYLSNYHPIIPDSESQTFSFFCGFERNQPLYFAMMG